MRSHINIEARGETGTLICERQRDRASESDEVREQEDVTEGGEEKKEEGEEAEKLSLDDVVKLSGKLKFLRSLLDKVHEGTLYTYLRDFHDLITLYISVCIYISYIDRYRK